MTSSTLTYKPLAGARLNMAHPLAKNMVLCMLLNEQGSRAMDLSPYQANGALSGFGSPAKRAFNGLQFIAATPSYIEIPASHTQLNFTSGDLTIIARIYPEDVTSTYFYIFTRGQRNIDGYSLWIEASTQKPWFSTHQTEAFQDTKGTALVAGTGYTVGVSRSGTSAIIYQNGVNATTVSSVHIDPLTTAKTALIGIYNNKVQYGFNGKIAFVYIYGHRSLSEAEHRAIHESPYAPYGYNLFL